jgi:hypothetical protein
LQGCKVIVLSGITEHRYQREEIHSIEACDALKKRTEKEIADEEKKSAIRRKVEEVRKKQEDGK